MISAKINTERPQIYVEFVKLVLSIGDRSETIKLNILDTSKTLNMKRFLLGAALLLSMVSCHDEKLTGDIQVRVNATVNNVVNIRLFNSAIFSAGGSSDADALDVQPLLGGVATFSGINPGDYVVAVDVQPRIYYQAVQVKVGQSVTATIR